MKHFEGKLNELVIEAIARLEALGTQPTARQVSMAFGQHDGWAKPTLLRMVAAGLIRSAPEWIERAKGEFSVYHCLPAVWDTEPASAVL